MVARPFGNKGSKQKADGKYDGRVEKMQEDGQTLIFGLGCYLGGV